MSGLSLCEMTERVESRKYSVGTDTSPRASSSGWRSSTSTATCSRSNRFAGFSSAPRPRMFGCASIEEAYHRYSLNFRHSWRGNQERTTAHGDEGEAGNEAQEAGGPEGGAVVARDGADRAGAEGGHARAQLMAGADPAVDDAGVFAAEGIGREPHGRWHGR